MNQKASSLYWKMICELSPERAAIFLHPAYDEIPNDALIRNFKQDGAPLVSMESGEIQFMLLCFIHEYLEGEGL